MPEKQAIPTIAATFITFKCICFESKLLETDALSENIQLASAANQNEQILQTILGSKSRDLFTFESKVFPEATSRKFNYFFQKRQIQKINFELFGEKNPLCLPITP